MRAVAAPDKFRGSLDAAQACRAIAAAVTAAGGQCVQRPMSDGGEGLLAAFGGSNRAAVVTGPAGGPVTAGWILKPDGVAIIESAEACGLVLAGGIGRNDPIAATTHGVGELIVAAVEAGCERIMLGLGGSATTDGGSGAVTALTAEFGDKLPVPVTICCDVRTRFLDAARVFGPQKGADPEAVRFLTARLESVRRSYVEEFGRDVQAVDGSGAAGGLAGGLWCLGAQLLPGFEQIAVEVGLPALIDDCDLVITGEGKFDEGSLAGKVVGGVVQLASSRGVPTLVVAGAVDPVELDPSLNATVVGLVDRFGADSAWQRTAECITELVADYLDGPRRATRSA